MTPADLLATARALGATAVLDDTGLVFRRAGAIPAELRPLYSEHQEALIELLRLEAPHPNNIGPDPLVGDGYPLGTLSALVRSREALSALAARVSGTTTPVGLAVATTGPDPLLHSVVYLGLGLAQDLVVVDVVATDGLGPLADALRNIKVIGHNLRHALAFLQHHDGAMPPVETDIEILSKLLDGGRCLDAEAHSLDTLAKKHLRLQLPVAPLHADVAARAPHVAVALALRVGAVAKLASTFVTEVSARRLQDAVFLERKVLPSVVETSLVGVGLDADRLREVMAEREAEMERCAGVLRDALGEVNIGDDKAVLKALRDYGLAVEKTGKDGLAAHLHDPVAQALVTYRKRASFVRDLGPKMLANAAKYLDGRVRPEIDPMGTATGRFTYSAPNLQGLEKGDEVRSCIVPAPGHVFVVADYAAIDLRVLADHTKDPALVAAFNAGSDLHRATAARLAKKSSAEVTPEERRRAKAINFGVVYGMGAETLATYLFTKFGEVVTVEEAQRLLDEYLGAYPKVAAWQERTRDAPAAELRTASGRLRRFGPGDTYAQRLNAPIQGTVADGLKLALIKLRGALPNYGARVVLTVHDEIVVEAPRENAAAAAANLRGNMVAAMGYFVKAVPIEVEVSVRTTWAENSIVELGGGQ